MKIKFKITQPGEWQPSLSSNLSSKKQGEFKHH